ncbi:MAG: diaminopimelate epimerase [Prolixibacteraceae bacterium]|jgi:diaminopimelate epimerase|nr:diaminopimelate epimerase [Prolixibacteraceae bacterium]
MEMNFFVKTHGLGNEYIVFDRAAIDFELTRERIVQLCNIHVGIGSDGILLKVPTGKADFGLRILNPDGSEAEKSGNGLRIFAKYLFDYGFTEKHQFTIDTLGGVVTAHILQLVGGKAFMIRVDIGKANFRAAEIPVTFSMEECFNEPVSINGNLYHFHCVSVGNPHCVVLRETLDAEEIKRVGTLIENHPMFPNRINVQFVKVISQNEVEALIWERGAGFTQASGSSSSAIAAVMVKKGLTDRNISVRMPGGVLKLEVDEEWNIRLTGEVREIASGILSRELFR